MASRAVCQNQPISNEWVSKMILSKGTKALISLNYTHVILRQVKVEGGEKMKYSADHSWFEDLRNCLIRATNFLMLSRNLAEIGRTTMF